MRYISEATINLALALVVSAFISCIVCLFRSNAHAKPTLDFGAEVIVTSGFYKRCKGLVLDFDQYRNSYSVQATCHPAGKPTAAYTKQLEVPASELRAQDE